MTRPGWSPPWDAWTPPQDARLQELAGSGSYADLAAQLSEEFGIPRSAQAIRVRAKRLGISLWRHGYSLRDLERIFRYDHRAIVNWWVFEGLLDAQRIDGRGPYARWLFTEAQVEAFVRDHGYVYDWRRMQRGHRLRSLAEMAAKRDPWVTRDVAMRYIGISSVNFKRWQNRGLIPHKRRPLAGPAGQVMIRASDLPAIKERIAAAREHAYMLTTEQFTVMRRSAGKAA